MQAVILAGGAGTRLGKLTQDTPKVLIKIGKKPIIEHQILLLARYGFKNIWVLSGHLGTQVKEYLGNGEKWRVSINHIIEDVPLGSGGALKNLEGKIKDDFLVLSGDVMLDIDLKRLIAFHRSHKNQIATIVVHPSDHPQDSDLVETDTTGKVSRFLIRKKKQSFFANKTQTLGTPYHNLTNTGIFIFSVKIFNFIKKNQKSDIEKDIFLKILNSGGLIYAYNTPEYIKDMGTPQRLAEVQRDFRLGKIARFNRENKRPAIFVDRDGTINELVPDLAKIDDFKLLPASAMAIKKINTSDYLTIVITNQPQVAKGMLKIAELETIHKKMETDLGRLGAKLDAIYMCPHHPEAGFREEIKSLKIDCICRKPKIGLIKRAARDFNIDLSRSFLIGDSTIDAQTAENAHLKFIGVKTGYSLKDHKFKVKKDPQMSDDLFQAVNIILASS